MSMTCSKCGEEIGTGIKFCPSCGKPTEEVDTEEHVHSVDVVGDDPFGEAIAFGFYGSLIYTVLTLFASLFLGGTSLFWTNPAFMIGPIGLLIFGALLLYLTARVSDLV